MMTVQKLAAGNTAAGGYYFSRDSMRFWGDTLSNFGVHDGGTITTRLGETIAVWELYHKKPNSQGVQGTAYFAKDNFRRVHIAHNKNQQEEASA